MDIVLRKADWHDLHKHMNTTNERAAFIFTHEAEPGHWIAVDQWLLEDPTVYKTSTEDHLVLSDDIRPRVIQRAHAGGLAVVEVHGHYWPGNHTRFSPYDLRNLAEFAPHMRWRLSNYPYVALVLGPDSLDALAWVGTGDVVVVPTVHVEDRQVFPTGLSLKPYAQIGKDNNG